METSSKENQASLITTAKPNLSLNGVTRDEQENAGTRVEELLNGLDEARVSFLAVGPDHFVGITRAYQSTHSVSRD